MNLLNKLTAKKKNTVLIVQCRLSSTRLPEKALLPLGGKTVLEWVLQSMKKVKADRYFLATDTESAPRLEKIAAGCNWEFFAGSKEDVLDRFCKVIELSKADVVVRATADNPFLFYEAAQALVEEYNKRSAVEQIDYITWTDLPHGSGVEMFDAHSLLKAREMTDLPYDHEHVGPSLYNHTDKFNAKFVKSPNRWSYPELRTTIDLPSDYRRALALVRVISGNKKVEEPYTTEQIIAGLWDTSVRNPILTIPCVKKGHGTGHLRRCIDLAIKAKADIFIPEDADLEQTKDLLEEAKSKGLEDWQIVHSLNDASHYAVAVTDLFRTENEIVKKLSSACPVIALDEGRAGTDYVDYLLDILPSFGLDRKPNYSEPGFIPLPQKRKNESDKPSAIHTAIVTLGGEDPSHLSLPVTKALAQNNIFVTVIQKDPELLIANIPEQLKKFVKTIGPQENLRDKLCEYDLVVTHYGFTAFEAAYANCAVILLGTTELHEKLAEKYNFECLQPVMISEESVRKIIVNGKNLYPKVKGDEQKKLSDFIIDLSNGKKLLCPVCQKQYDSKDALIARTGERTFRRCQKCSMLYQSWTIKSEQTEYNHAYFFEDYQKQYGKTYLEDFASIKAQCIRRTGNIDFIYHRNHQSITPAILDIGCAMGPFLDAANDAGWQVFGTDISKDAVEYVQRTLNFPAVCASFPEFNPEKEFGITQFDAVTMWYVIEHFQNLDNVLKAVSKIVKKDGIFAFSTPSASGVSSKYHRDNFFKQSPADHYTLWEPENAKLILRKYGFKVVKIVSTGHHPERFPFIQKHGYKKESLAFKLVNRMSHVMNLGDTFEIYCKKINDITE